MNQDIDILARTIWGEARGEHARGMRAVAHVVRNRVVLSESGIVTWWGKTITGVCQKPYQFSCWNKNDPNHDIILCVDNHDAVFRQACAIATTMTQEVVPFDITHGATHYHRFDMTPKWARGVDPCARIGRHVFYRIVS